MYHCHRLLPFLTLWQTNLEVPKKHHLFWVNHEEVEFGLDYQVSLT